MFYICSLQWLYPPFVQQWRRSFCQCSSQQFSLLPGRTYSSCVSPQLFPLLFCKILHKPDDFVCIFNFFQAIILYMVWVLFTTFGACLSSSTRLSVMSIFLAFKAPQGSWNVLLNSLITIADFYLPRNMGMVKCRDVSVGLDSLFAFSHGDSSSVCTSLFPQGWCYLLFYSQCQLPNPDNSLRNIEFLMWVGSTFRRMKVFFCFFCLISFLPAAGCPLRQASCYSLFSLQFSD